MLCHLAEHWIYVAYCRSLLQLTAPHIIACSVRKSKEMINLHPFGGFSFNHAAPAETAPAPPPSAGWSPDTAPSSNAPAPADAPPAVGTLLDTPAGA